MQQSLGLLQLPALFPYALTAFILSLNLLLLWIYSGILRAGGDVALNPEDGAYFGRPVSDVDPPAVARLLRAHRNAEATIYPFLLLGLIYVLVGGTARIAIPIFALFVIARIVYSIAYVKALQPWRTNFFAIGMLAILLLIAALGYTLLTN